MPGKTGKKAKVRKQRGPRGAGTIFPHPTKGWVGRVIVGRKPNGKPHYVERSGKRQDVVLKKLALVKPPGPDTTVLEWGARWLAASQARASTRADYLHTLEQFIYPSLGHLRLTDVTPFHVEEAAKVWSARLNVGTLRKNLTHLSGLFTSARRARLVTENPVSLARRPKAKRATIDPFTAADVNQIVSAATNWATRPYAILATTGCRIGEAQALDVEDVKGDTLSITKTYSREYGLGPPKSERGVRTIRVAASGIPALRAAVGGRESGPLFPTLDGGTRRQHSSLLRGFATFLAGLGIRYRNPHQLRHAVATGMIAAGVPIGDVARHLGDTVGVVVRTYVHPTNTDAVAGYERFLAGG